MAYDPLQKALDMLKQRQEDTPYISVHQSLLNKVVDIPALTEFMWHTNAGLGWKAQSLVTKLALQLGCDEDQFCLIDMRDPNQPKKLKTDYKEAMCFVVVDENVPGDEYPRVS